MRPEVYGAFLEHLSRMSKHADANDTLEGGRHYLADSDKGFVMQFLAGKKGKKIEPAEVDTLAAKLQLRPEAVEGFILELAGRGAQGT